MSSYYGTAPQGDPKATGAYAVAIAAQTGTPNNAGHATDSAGNVAVDFVWGATLPLQPNDERRATPTNIGGSTGDTGWSATTYVTSANLAYGNLTVNLNNGITSSVFADNHVRAESGYAGYPSYTTSHQNVYIITQASGDGTTRTYTAPNNFLKAGDTVNITGTGLDGTNLTVASANRYTFTVTASGTGSYTNISGTARYTDETTANDGAYVSGVDYVVVPNVVGLSTASATDAMNDAELVPTTASGVTPAITNVVLTSNVATIITAAAHGFAVGDLVTVAAVTATTINATLAPITAVTSTTFSYAKTATNVVSAVDTGTAKVPARFNTIKTQSVAAGAASISAGTAVTLTPYAAS